MRLTVATVLRSGGEYTAEHVERLSRQVRQTTPGCAFVCLSDERLDLPGVGWMPLEHDWPGWWSKIELFRPGLWTGPTLYLDLDTDVVANVSPLAHTPRFTMLSDFYRPEHPASGVMAWPAGGPPGVVYRRFRDDPTRHQHRCRRAGLWGDQGFIRESTSASSPLRFPVGPIVSYKAHCRRPDGTHALPGEARVVAYHGRPRPWDAPADWALTIQRRRG